MAIAAYARSKTSSTCSQTHSTRVEVVHASRRELARVGLTPNDFILYHHPMTEYPHVLDSYKLASLGWGSTPVEAAIERTVEESAASGRDGSAHAPAVMPRNVSSKRWPGKYIDCF